MVSQRKFLPTTKVRSSRITIWKGKYYNGINYTQANYPMLSSSTGGKQIHVYICRDHFHTSTLRACQWWLECSNSILDWFGLVLSSKDLDPKRWESLKIPKIPFNRHVLYISLLLFQMFWEHFVPHIMLYIWAQLHSYVPVFSKSFLWWLLSCLSPPVRSSPGMAEFNNCMHDSSALVWRRKSREENSTWIQQIHIIVSSIQIHI